MSQPKLIYRTDGEWMAILCDGNLFDTLGEWIGWLEDDDVYSLEGEYVGFISEDGRLLRPRVLPYRQRKRPPEQPPRFQAPPSVPLPPLFRELSYDVVDVFEAVPETFALVSDLHPDAGEGAFPGDKSAPFRQQLTQDQQEALEKMVLGMIQSYGTTEPPVPVEAIASGLRPSQASSVETAPAHDRLQLAERTIARLGHSLWAVERGYCGPEGFTPPQVQYAARALLMPRPWLLNIPKALLRPWALAHRYAVSEETATLRLYDLSLKF
jgi:hypothetical protein